MRGHAGAYHAGMRQPTDARIEQLGRDAGVWHRHGGPGEIRMTHIARDLLADRRG